MSQRQTTGDDHQLDDLDLPLDELESIKASMVERSRNTIDTRTQGIAQCNTSQKTDRNNNPSTQCYQNFTPRHMQLALTPITITSALTVMICNQQSLYQRYLFQSEKKTDLGKRSSLLTQTESSPGIFYDDLEASGANGSVSRFSTVFTLEGQGCVSHHQIIAGLIRRCPA